VIDRSCFPMSDDTPAVPLGAGIYFALAQERRSEWLVQPNRTS
jgi:hypothetical protein